MPAAGNGFRVRVSVYFAVILACILVLDTSGVAVLALLCAAFHEAGHCAALMLFRVPVDEVSFRAFGIGIRLRHNERISYPQEVAVALAGCAANLLLCALTLPLCVFGRLRPQAEVFILMNLLIAAFNALPVAPLDGGRALEALLCRHFSPLAARRAVDAVSVVLDIPLTFLGVMLLVKTGCNFSLLLAAAYLIVSIALKGRLIDIR